MPGQAVISQQDLDELKMVILVGPMLGRMSGIDGHGNVYVPENADVIDAVECAQVALLQIRKFLEP